MESNTIQSMGKMENGKATPYNFSVSGLISAAWHSIKGYKAILLGAIVYWLITVLALLIVLGLVNAVGVKLFAVDTELMQQICSLILTIATLPLVVGMAMLGIRRSVSLPVKSRDIFNYYKRFWPIFGVYAVEVLICSGIVLLAIVCGVTAKNAASFVSILLSIGSFVLSLFFVYLVVGYMFAMVIRVEKNLTLWQSLEASRKGISQHWFKVFFGMILVSIVVSISSIPLGIGLIWTLPLMNLFFGMLYRTMFGVEEVR